MGKDNKKAGGSGGKDKKAGSGSGSSSKESSSGSKDDKLKPCTSINVRHVLCAKHSQITAALERLGAGEAFDKVARELSEDKARQGGSLGWQIRGAMVKEFEDVAFKLPVSKTDRPSYNMEPVKSGFGYHVIMVEGRK